MRPICPACKSPRYEFDENQSTWKCRNSMCWHEEHVPRSPEPEPMPSKDQILLDRIEGIYKMLEDINVRLDSMKEKKAAPQKPKAGAT